MLEAGVIEPASSEWASPVVLVPKPDGSLRFCVDYRRLNALTIRDSYPLPRMDECVDSLGDSCDFTTLDCNSGYCQIPVAPDDMDKTTFTSHEGTYRFRRMPFVVRNAPATFQRTVEIVLSGLT
jgi:Reverse transcriptase (RNA-dependent DNA polymerase)